MDFKSSEPLEVAYKKHWGFDNEYTGIFSLQGLFSTWHMRQHDRQHNRQHDTMRQTQSTEHNLDKVIGELKHHAKVLFFNDTSWFSRHHQHLDVYGVYCDKHRNGVYSLHSSDIAAEFLRWVLDVHFVKKKGEKSIHFTRFNVFRKDYVPVLQRVALWQGYYELSQGLLGQGKVHILYRELLLLKSQSERDEVVDYAATSRNRTKRLHHNERERAAEAIYSGLNTQPKIAMRTSVEHFLLLGNGRRGEDIRSIKLSQLQLSSLTSVGPQPCWVIGASLRDVKERVCNMETLIGWMRTKDRMHCPIGALACYLVWLIDMDGAQILQTMYKDLQTLEADGKEGYNPRWRRMYLVFGKDIYAPVSPTTHTCDVNKVLEEGQITGKKAKTHLGRNTVLCNETEAGVNHVDVRGHMGLEHTTSTDVYLRGSYWTRPMLAAAGWLDLNSFYCWWESDSSLIPTPLKALVFPTLDGLYEYAVRVNDKTGGDYSAVEFLKVLGYLRKVFLEDAVVKRDVNPTFPPYSHPVFSTLLWNQYKEGEAQRVAAREKTWKNKDSDVKGCLEQLREAQEASARRHEKALREIIDSFSLNKDVGVKKSSSHSERLLGASVPLPTFPEKLLDMNTFYTGWSARDRQMLELHMKSNGGRIAWGKVWDKAEAKKQAIRYQRYQDWLAYLDSLDQSSVKNALVVMNLFALEGGWSHNVLVKQIFYYAVKEEGASCEKTIREAGKKLLNVIERSGLPLPPTKKVQKHKDVKSV